MKHHQTDKTYFGIPSTFFSRVSLSNISVLKKGHIIHIIIEHCVTQKLFTGP